MENTVAKQEDERTWDEPWRMAWCRLLESVKP